MDNCISINKDGRIYVTAKDGYVVCLNGGIGGVELVTAEHNAHLIECITTEENERRIQEQERLQQEQEEQMRREMEQNA